MKNSKLRSLALAVAITGSWLAAAPASAAPTLSYGALPGAGTYYGSGNFDTNWTIGTNSGIVLGLGFKDRQSFALLDGSDGTYFSALGNYAGGGSKQHTSYQFSVDTTGYAASTAPLTYSLCVDHDPTAAGVALSCVNPGTYWVDNNVAPNPFIGFQNSENIGFGDTPGGAFNPAMNGTFDFVLTAFSGNVMVDQVSARVQIGDALAVPEPGSMLLVGLGMGLLVWASRRKPARNGQQGLRAERATPNAALTG
jgi:hypothetical protein